MDLQPNKIDGMYLPITNTRISASEWNQLVGSCMAFITEAGLTPDAEDNEQFLNAFKTIAAGLEIVGANTNLSNLTATGEARFTTKADTDLGNVSATGKNTAIGWGMPDYSAGVDISSYSSSSNQFTVPVSGIIYADAYISSNGGVYVDNIRITGGNASSGSSTPSTVIVSKNSTVYISFPDTRYAGCHFYPLKGAN